MVVSHALYQIRGHYHLPFPDPHIKEVKVWQHKRWRYFPASGDVMPKTQPASAEILQRVFSISYDAVYFILRCVHVISQNLFRSTDSIHCP